MPLQSVFELKTNTRCDLIQKSIHSLWRLGRLPVLPVQSPASEECVSFFRLYVFVGAHPMNIFAEKNTCVSVRVWRGNAMHLQAAIEKTRRTCSIAAGLLFLTVLRISPAEKVRGQRRPRAAPLKSPPPSTPSPQVPAHYSLLDRPRMAALSRTIIINSQ